LGCVFRFALTRLKIRVRAVLDSNELFPGADCHVSIELENDSDRKIKRGTVSLLGHLRATAGGYTETSWLPAASVDLRSVPHLLPLLPNVRTDCRVSLAVPPECAPSLTLASGSISWFVNVSLKFGLTSASVKIPVIMQAPCPRSLAWFPAVPVMGVSERYAGPVNFSALDSREPLEWWSLLPSDCK
jgi:hypothetical protein